MAVELPLYDGSASVGFDKTKNNNNNVILIAAGYRLQQWEWKRE